ncbi:MAG: hypothetical protein LBV62_00615 [Rickettsiales bacterium]|nr:hypothetical protein [Rickettsiales bacterium]
MEKLVEARMENFLKKVKELNNDVPNSSMTRTSSTASMYSLNGRKAGS